MSKEENEITVQVDLASVKKELMDEIASQFKDLKESLVPAEKPKSATEPLEGSKPEDYREKLVENLKKCPTIGEGGWKWNGPEDNEEAKTLVGEVNVTDPELRETLTCGTFTHAIPEVWAADVERLSVYPNSAFWGAPYINWKKDILGKPGDTVNVITVAPVICTDLVCEEPDLAAAAVAKVPITLVDKVCAYCICKQDMEDVVPDTVDQFNAGLATCLDVCIDNYFLSQAQIGANLGTYTHTAGMTGSLIARAMGSMEAGNRHNSTVSYIV